MTKEDNIIVPRWFLEVVENTLQIQHNINLDKKTEETCQDRNIRQSLNGVRKLLNGEELTGMERLEKLQTSLPSNLDEAAKEYADYNSQRWHEDGDVYYDHDKIMDAFKAGAEWMTEQGETLEGEVMKDINNKLVVSAKGLSGTETKFGDKVIVQIRKKQ